MKNQAHYTIKELPAELRNIANWPLFDPSTIVVEADRIRYNACRKGVESYLSGQTLKRSASEANVTQSEFSRLFRRCTTISVGTQIIGLRALVRYNRIFDYNRSQADSHGGAESKQGMFSFLLAEKTTLQTVLDDAIQGKLASQENLSRIEKRNVYATFVAECRRLKITQCEYPLNTESKGRRSVYRYIDDYLDRHEEAYKLHFGNMAGKRLQIGKGPRSFELVRQPYAVVHLDAHKSDVIGTIEIKGSRGPMRVPIARLWKVVLFDGFTSACLGQSISYEAEVSAETIERALINAFTKWVPGPLRAPRTYKTGSGYPYGGVAGITGCPIVLLKVDNALVHMSRILNDAADALGFVLCWGGVGKFWTNAILERFFKTLNSRGIHQRSTTMGSGPSDPQRPVNPTRVAVEKSVDWTDVNEEYDVLCANHNATLSTELDGRTPNGTLTDIFDLTLNKEGVIPRLLCHPHPSAPRLGFERGLKTVAGSREVGDVRRPYVEYLGIRYTNELLSSRFDLLGSKIVTYTRRSDMAMEAYLIDGTSIGWLKRQGRGAHIPMSLETRRMLRRSKNQTSLPDEDADAAYVAHLQELSKKAASDAEIKPFNISLAATQLAEAERQQLDIPEPVSAQRLASPEPRKILLPARLPGASPLNLKLRRPGR